MRKLWRVIHLGTPKIVRLRAETNRVYLLLEQGYQRYSIWLDWSDILGALETKLEEKPKE